MQILAAKVQSLLPHKKINVFGKDQLMHNSFPYYFLSTILLGALFTPIHTSFFFIFIIYTVLPFLDEYFSFDIRNPTESQRKQLQKNDFKFKLCLYVQIILDWMLFFKAMNTFATLELTPFNTFALIGFMFIFSNLNSVQFAVAHQIFHKPGKFHKYLGTFHMIKNLYMHFTYQHLYGHHRRVATPQDPASAEKGMTVYSFFWRSFFGSYKSVYEMEKKEYNKPFYLNYAVLSLVASFIFTLFVFKIYGVKAGILFLIQSFGSIFYLEAINYIEHYGLRRKKLENGSYEKVTIRHSWNAPHRFSNYLLFKLQRHSDHHENSLKPYQTLVSLDQSPHLPHGYSVSIFMSFFPQTWFKIMDPLVDAYNTSQKTDMNGQIMQKAVKETRIFVIKLAIMTLIMFVASLQLSSL